MTIKQDNVRLHALAATGPLWRKPEDQALIDAGLAEVWDTTEEGRESIDVTVAGMRLAHGISR